MEVALMTDRALDGLPWAVIGVDTEGRVVTWNAGAQQVFGWRADEVVGRPVPHIPPGREDEFRRDLQRVLGGESVVGREVLRVGKDARALRLEVSGGPTRHPDGRVSGAVALFRPLTQRPVPAAEATDGLYRMLVESSADLITLIDADGTIRYASPAVESVLGHTPAEVQGRSAFDLVVPESVAEVRERFARVLACEPAPALEFRVRHKDGSTRILAGIGRRVDTGPGVIASLRDVTGSRRSEESLRETENRYQVLFERNPFPMWAYDLETLRFLAVNDAAVEHYGYTRDEFLDMTIKDIRPPSEMDRLLEDVSSVARGDVDPRSWNAAVWKHRKKDGTAFDVEIRSTTLTFGGWQARLVLAKDVSGERKLEEQLRQAQKMDAVGRLAGGVAHDFNNVLFVISGYSEQILRRAEGVVKDKALGILKATDRAAALTRQLLMFSRKRAEHLEVLNLNDIVGEMEQMVRRLVGERVTLVTSPATDLWRVKVDPGHIEQVLMNLAVNARDAMPEGGQLVLETANVTLDRWYARTHVDVSPGDYVMLSVSDTGMGMDAEVLKQIFEPFFTTKSKEQGTGLGLAIVYGIVKQSGGSIEVYSHVGRGTTFKVYLPRATQDRERPSAQVPERVAPKGGSEAILIAEDEDDVRALAREALEEHGYTVLEATDAPMAIVLARKHRPQLLLTDMVLKTMIGSDLAEQMALVVPGIRAVFMSGYTNGALASQGEATSAARFLQKPFNLETLLRTVRDALDEPGTER